jgi:hypothetical protein
VELFLLIVAPDHTGVLVGTGPFTRRVLIIKSINSMHITLCTNAICT